MIIRNVKLLGLGLIALVCTGCAVGTVDSTASVQSNDDAYFVMGVDPPFTYVKIDRGTIENDKFSGSLAPLLWGMSAATFMGQPVDGFVVGKTNGGTALAITEVRPFTSKNDFLAVPRTSCASEDRARRLGSAYGKTVVFTPPAGKVVYVVSVTFTPMPDGSLAPSFHKDIKAARAFMKAHYPQLADKLEDGSYELLSTGFFCPP